MPKMKTFRGAKKRFRKTGSGKLRRHHAHHRHILTKKSRSKKRKLADSTGVSPSDAPRVRRLVPYL